MAIIGIENVAKRFRAARGVRALLGRGGIPDIVRGKRADEVTALEGITFEVEPGESLGIIGANGSGKSTLLKIVAGVTVPTEGNVRVYGRVASLLELGAGFHPLLSGRENVYLNAGIHGMRHAQVDAIFDRIVEFSGIGKFIDFPVATYSSGMYVRLGFAIAAHTNPDIFLIDEVLAVGDEEFQRKCRMKIGELMESGKTILFVSHDLAIVNALCRRVILLNRGEMITRGSPARAIDFYLRQTGTAGGVHTLRGDDLEVVVCDGRISVFLREQEVSSPRGFQCQMYYLGRWRTTREAAWRIEEKSDSHCVAVGHDPKLGLDWVWELRIDNGDLIWACSYRCKEPVTLEAIETNLFFHADYDQWFYDDESGGFPEVVPEDTAWAPVRAPEIVCEHAGILAKDEATRPAVTITAVSDRPGLRGAWFNSEYMSLSRIFHLQEHPTQGAESLPAGTTRAFELRVALGKGREALLNRRGEQGNKRTVIAGPLRGRFDRGQLRLSYNNTPITTALHVYMSLLIDNLWNDSGNLRWERLERDGDTLRALGVSRRFPFKLHWTVRPAGDGVIALDIDLDASETIDVQEYHTSILLTDAYDRWETAAESGAFPEIRPEATDWQHLNHTYEVGSYMRAHGPDLPRVMLENVAPDLPTRMTTLNTGYRERARVLQALRAAEHGRIHLPAGITRVSSTLIRVGGE